MATKWLLVLWLLMVLPTRMFLPVAPTMPGDLDPTFDGDGLAITSFEGGFEVAHSGALQKDGKIIVAGYVELDGSRDFALARYHPNGSLDASFSGDGLVSTDFAGGYDVASSVAIQHDGKIVVAGSVDIDFAVARYHEDGTLDTSFSGDGLVSTDFAGGYDMASSVAIQHDGKIVVVGWTGSFILGTGAIAVVRYQVDGTLDTSFDEDGRMTTTLGGVTDAAQSVAIQNDGKIVVAGYSHKGSDGNSYMALVRYQADGSLDTSFDEDGRVITDFGTGIAVAQGMTLQPDGKIVAVGSVFSHGTYLFAMARYHANGAPDTAFGEEGRVTTRFEEEAFAFHLALQSNGKIVVVGRAEFGNNTDFALARYHANGSLDTSFGEDGRVRSDFDGGLDAAQSVVIQNDGKIVAVGFADFGGDYVLALARYEGDPAPTSTSRLFLPLLKK